jgi:hypothetical protein
MAMGANGSKKTQQKALCKQNGVKNISQKIDKNPKPIFLDFFITLLGVSR